jgi:hypothetical protein
MVPPHRLVHVRYAVGDLAVDGDPLAGLHE